MIKSISIKNFKTIENLPNLKLDRFVSIVGANGAGKSNLIQAINLTNRLSRGMTIDEALVEIAPFPSEIFPFSHPNEEIEISLKIKSLKGSYFTYTYTISNNDNSVDPVVPFLSITTEVMKEAESIIFERIGENIISNVGGKRQSVPLKVKADRLVINSYAEEKVQDLTDTLSSYNIINDIIVDEFKLVNPESPNLKSLDGIVTALYKKRDSFKDAVSECKQIIDNFSEPSIIDMGKLVNPDVSDDSVKREEEGTRVFVRWNDKISKKYSTYFSLSNGDIRTSFIIFSLYNAARGSLVIIEELENGLHKSRLKKLIELVDIISANRGLQVIFTTHNMDIAQHMTVANTILVRKSLEGISHYIYMADTPEYKRVEDLVEQNPSASELLNSGIY